MKQYLDLLKHINENGTQKGEARENMPTTKSIFGYQFRHNLADGFPLLTTKKIDFKNIVVELLWFLRGDTNIKFLVDNGVNIWNEDAYNYYLKVCKIKQHPPMQLSEFTDCILRNSTEQNNLWKSEYTLGDCGFQYGKVWRNFYSGEGKQLVLDESNPFGFSGKTVGVDQIKNLIEGLKKNPESRRHIVTAIDPAHDTELALYWCHAMFQFNCRQIKREKRQELFGEVVEYMTDEQLDKANAPKYYLDCQLYQRSADVILGVPYNIASYALLTHIIAKICNMIPGEFIHSFGDVHIYSNHQEAVDEQLKRIPTELPTLRIKNKVEEFWYFDQSIDIDFDSIKLDDFQLENYNPQSRIKAELSTGLKKEEKK